jgi:uncharacterized protein
MKKQVVIIGGGTVFRKDKDYLDSLKNLEINLDKYRGTSWKNKLISQLGNNFDVLILKMPNPANAKYSQWKIIFDKVAPLLENNVVLIGHSLGGIFLAKYLSENKFPKKILASILIAAPYDEENSEEPLADFNLRKNLARFAKQGGRIFIYQSKDDPVVPFANLAKYQQDLPKAVVRIFKKRGHFNQEKFPELAKEIKNLYAKKD